MTGITHRSDLAHCAQSRVEVSSGLLWLLAGGLLYMAGVIFYAWKIVPYNHAIWHGFVLAGSTCHYFAVLCSVILPVKGLQTI